MMKRWLFALVFMCSFAAFAKEPFVTFSHQGGFYEKPFYLNLSCPDAYSIHYTVNGNVPTVLDSEYEKPLLLNQALYSHSDIYTVQTCSDESWYVPDSVHHIIILRAAAFDGNGNRYGEVVTHSYIIKSLGNDFHDLPVVSICTDSLSLFGFDSGIFVQGATGANYDQHGRDWERLCNVEFYENESEGINQQVGLRIHGGWMRGAIQKGLRLYARKEYGCSRLHYPFFGKNGINSYKHLVLRPFGNELFRDHLCTKIGKDLNFEMPASRPVVVFINGEYWGLYFLKERPDDRYIEDHYGYDKKEVNIIESWSGTVFKGNNEGFLRMMRWVMQADMSNDSVYQQASKIIDIDCFIDYYCFQLFMANGDWPNNNMRCWQAQDGKWRWIFYDGGFCMASYRQMLYSTIFNDENQDVSTFLFTKLLSNACFRGQFYHRFGILLTNEFYSKETHKAFDLVVNSIEYEIDPYYRRFGLKDYENPFDFQVTYLKDFLNIRIVSAASMIYSLYYYNNWEYPDSKSKKNVRFYEMGGKRPKFLFRMARQFKDWRYVTAYFSYRRFRIKNDIKESEFRKSLKNSKIRKKIRGVL